MSEAVVPPVDEQLQGAPEVEASTTDPTAAEGEGQQETTSQDANQGEPTGGEEGRRKSGQYRMNRKFDRQVEDLQREVEHWRKAALEGLPREQPASEDAEPQIADYDHIGEYIKARDAWMESRLTDKVLRSVQQRTQHSSVMAAHDKRVEAAKAELADWDDVFDDAGDLKVLPDTAQFVMESEVGPRIAYHLAKNPAELDRLNRLSPSRRLAELGKLEDRLDKPVQQPTRRVSAAPAKLADVKGGSTEPLNAKPRDYAEWKAAEAKRLAGLKKH